MNNSHLLVEKLQGTGRWSGPPRVTPLPGGITNRNYLIDGDEGRFVARVYEELPHLGIDRRAEVLSQQAASHLGIAPEVVHHEDSLLISRYMPGRTLRPDDLRESSMVGSLAQTLRRLHQAWDRIIGHLPYFCPFQTIRTYARTAMNLKARVPAELSSLVDDASAVGRRIQPFRPVLCHNDLLPANILWDGEQMRLVDWEYAGMGHPLFDLASVSANAGLTQAEDHRFLQLYQGQADTLALREIQIFKAASSLREALWATIQAVRSSLDFDYHAYAATHLEAYRIQRSRLE
jgi:thiamine kinase-like enzyme